MCGDVLAQASRGRVFGGPFDLVLLDPPYAMGAAPVEELLGHLRERGALAPGALAVHEHAARDCGARPEGFEILREKRYGICAVDLLRFGAGTTVRGRRRSPVRSEGMDSSITHVLVPGTFDPITYGHLDVVRRARRLCPRVTVAVAASLGKNGVGTTFSLDERVAPRARGARGARRGGGPAVHGAPRRLRARGGRRRGSQGAQGYDGLRVELQQADLNYRLDASLESIFVMSSPEFGYLSSSAVRQIASCGGDVELFVPACVAQALKERFKIATLDHMW